MKSVLLEHYNKGKQFNVVLTTTVEFKVNKLLDYKTHAQKVFFFDNIYYVFFLCLCLKT